LGNNYGNFGLRDADVLELIEKPLEFLPGVASMRPDRDYRLETKGFQLMNNQDQTTCLCLEKGLFKMIWFLIFLLSHFVIFGRFNTLLQRVFDFFVINIFIFQERIREHVPVLKSHTTSESGVKRTTNMNQHGRQEEPLLARSGML
jgi:hypothetical protein